MIRFFFATAIIFTCSVFITAQDSTPKDVPPIFQASQPFTNLEEAKSTLDSFESNLRRNQKGKGAVGYIYVYGGLNSCADESRKIARILIRHILNEREYDSPRITIVEAGFRLEAAYDLFVLLPGSKPPEPTPTLNEKGIQILSDDEPRCNQLEDALVEKDGA